MNRRLLAQLLAFLVALVAAAAWAGCANSDIVAFSDDAGPDGTDDDGGCMFCTDAAAQLVISPANQTFHVDYRNAQAVATFTATLNGAPVTATWDIDRGELGTIDATSGTLTAKATLGGTASVHATAGGAEGTTHATIFVTYEENGDTYGGDAGCGTGGCGGVGGEGTGQPVSAGTLGTLKGAPVSDPGLSSLYPYDGTVWPRGILAPLSQWQVGAQGDYDAIYIHAYEGAFDYKGYFSKTATPFIHHPIPEDAWSALEYSNQGGEDLAVDIVLSKGSTAYGPISRKWKVAAGSLRGTVYYQSYGTNLVHNSGIVGEETYNYINYKTGPQYFGAATLAIRHGAKDPTLVAGSDTQCLVCHSVSADGSMLVTQQAGGFIDSASVAVNLKTLAQTPMPGSGTFGWPALYPDGKTLFSQSEGLNVHNPDPSGLYSVPAGASLTAKGVPSGLGALTPMFSPDGTKIAFNYHAGPSADQKSLWMMTFDKKDTFSPPVALDVPSTGVGDVFPAFLPTSTGVIFERQLVMGSDGAVGWTRGGARGELWWVDTVTKQKAPLSRLNGTGDVPKLANAHDDDATLNYEPTVARVASGGYMWVVFTSRRAYGNVATIDPYWSYPKEHDLSTNPTPKKLWVAAIDLNPKPGTDPSHPAFYLPGQELLAGNSRGFWSVDPCSQDGTSCEHGDECCGGFCRTQNGAMVCQPKPPGCAQELEACSSSGDCCAGVCIGGYCAVIPQY